jgi:hypothetical protein
VFHRWMAVRRERAALAHMPRIRASSAPARDRTRMREHTRAPIHYIPGLGIDLHKYTVHDVCVGYVSRRTFPRAHVMATAASSARAIRRSARRRAGSGAYKVQRVDRRGVPRADIGVERRRRVERLRAEAAHGRCRRAGLARLRVSGTGRARSTSPPTRAHTADPSPSHTRTRTHNPDRFSHIQING